ncbi:lysophospholipid acyltransferase family protein [Numidum massiliense]|uniref:lysophospholipid acyltransferase family protein n=1 Tax=Numidum massiliense TaxID=1522315 RepID=UPI0006D53234|nr:lysophospholipid acyltransferase family protein [Numidum massiliense]
MFYRIVRAIVYAYMHVRFRIAIKGLENIPEGGCILAMNHTSNYDPVMVGIHTPRKMHTMAKEELFANRLFGKILSELGAFPIKRGKGDIRSLKTSIRLVQEGNIFAIFIEGTRSKTGEMQVPKKGVGFITTKSKSPVIPTYIYGVKGGWFARAGVVFGEPLQFESTDYEEVTNEIAAAIKQLADEQRERPSA